MGIKNNFSQDIGCVVEVDGSALELSVQMLNNHQRIRFLASYNVECPGGVETGYPRWTFLIEGETFGPYDLASIPASLLLSGGGPHDGITLDITKVGGDSLHLEFSTASGFDDTLLVQATFELKDQCNQMLTDIEVGGITYQDPLAAFTYSDLATLGDYQFTDQSTSQGCPGGITTWNWTVSGVAGVDYNFLGGTNASSQNPQLQFLKVNQVYTITLTVTTVCGSSSTTSQQVYGVLPPAVLKLGNAIGTFVSGADADIDLTTGAGIAKFKMDMKTYAGAAILPTNTDLYYRLTITNAWTNQVMWDLWAPHNCNLYICTDASSTLPENLSGNEVRVESGDVFGTYGLKSYIPIGSPIAHTGVISIDKLARQLKYGKTCFVNDLAFIEEWRVDMEMHSKSTGGLISSAGTVIRRGRSLGRFRGPIGIDYDVPTNSLYLAAGTNSRIKRITLTDDPEVRHIQVNSIPDGIAAVRVWRQPGSVSGFPNVLISKVNSRGIWQVPSGATLGSILCQEQGYWNQTFEEITENTVTRTYSLQADPVITRYVNGYPLIWYRRNNDGNVVDFSYFDGVDWVYGSEIEFTSKSLGQSINYFTIDSQGRVWGSGVGFLVLGYYSGASPTDPTGWVPGDFTNKLLAGDETIASFVMGTGDVARFGSITGIWIGQDPYPGTAYPEIFLADSTNHVVLRVIHDGTAGEAAVNFIVSHVYGTQGVQGDTDANGTSAQFRFPYVGVYVASEQKSYVCDRDNNSIRILDHTTDDVTTMAPDDGQGDNENVYF